MKRINKIYTVTEEDEYTGRTVILYRGTSKKQAQDIKKEYWNATFRSFYAPK